MFEVIEREMIVPNLHLLKVHAPDVAEGILPGQFIIIRSHDDAERIPVSISDWDRDEGTLTAIFLEVGASTSRMAGLKSGDFMPTVVGPLGKPTEIEHYGTVLCVGGCYGIGSLFPIIRALKEKENDVYMVLEGRSRFLLYWQKKLLPFVKKLLFITRDGTAGIKGHVSNMEELLRKHEIVPDRIIVNGCTFLLSRSSKVLSHYKVPIIVSLNPIMIDGTGMCGVCRVTVDGEMKFACVDGPDFDGRLVDWEELLKRRKQYISEESFLVHDTGCGRTSS